jgi:hypothetical protein
VNNLRILQQTIWDFSRFFGALTERHLKEAKGVTALLRSFFALSFEFKSGRLRPEDLKDWLSTSMYMLLKDEEDNNRKPSRCEAAVKRYQYGIDLSGTFLSAKLVEDIFVKGIVDYSEIRSYLDTTSYFVDRGTEPPWRTVWHWLVRTEEEFNNAYNEMERQFAAREFLETGVILHVFGLRLFLADAGILKKPRADVVSEGKQYVDDLYAKGCLEALPIRGSEDVLLGGGYDGLVVHEVNSQEFHELSKYLEEKRKKATEDKYPELAMDLLKEMETDPHLYQRRLSLTNSEDNWYYRIPILSFVDAETFVSSLLRQSPEHQRIIWATFKPRYEHHGLKKELAAERTWLEQVRAKLHQRAESMSEIGKYRVQQSIKIFIDPWLT